MNRAVSDRLGETGIIAVLVIDRAEDAVPVAEALWRGGIKGMELTLRTEAAMESLRRIRKALPEMLAGIGTVLTTDQVREVSEADADFAVAPGFNPAVVEAAAECGVPFAPGVATPSDIERAIGVGCKTLKYFPAEQLGGIPYLKAVAAPYAHLGVRFMPLGGIGIGNVADYLKLGEVVAVGGSWLAPRPLIQASDWAAIEERARTAVELL